jgi:hypothetical protein
MKNLLPFVFSASALFGCAPSEQAYDTSDSALAAEDKTTDSCHRYLCSTKVVTGTSNMEPNYFCQATSNASGIFYRTNLNAMSDWLCTDTGAASSAMCGEPVGVINCEQTIKSRFTTVEGTTESSCTNGVFELAGPKSCWDYSTSLRIESSCLNTETGEVTGATDSYVSSLLRPAPSIPSTPTCW